MDKELKDFITFKVEQLFRTEGREITKQSVVDFIKAEMGKGKTGKVADFIREYGASKMMLNPESIKSAFAPFADLVGMSVADLKAALTTDTSLMDTFRKFMIGTSVSVACEKVDAKFDAMGAA